MTQMVVGYHLIDSSNVVIQSWGGTWGQCPGVPNPLILPNGDYVHGASIDTEYSGYTLVEWLMDEPPMLVPVSITRRQCALQLVNVGMATYPEALAMTQTGTPPVTIQEQFDLLGEPSRTLAMIDFAATNYFRDNPLIAELMTSNGMTPQQVDDFFRAASLL